jgi:DNA-binding GntR family transcriptional regulator
VTSGGQGRKELAGYESKQEVIAKLLQDEILSGRLRPGAVLRQEDLADRFGVSPTPIREALRELGARGLVVHEVHRGFHVADFRTDTLEEIVQIRGLLEPYATHLATPLLEEAELAELRAINAAMGAEATSQEENRILNRKFHMLIYERTGSRHLNALINLTWAAYPWRSLVLPRERVATACGQHDAVLAAIAERDADGAAGLMRQHVMANLVELVSTRG